MKIFQAGLIWTLATLAGCNNTYPLDYDVEVKFKDFDWNKRIEGATGSYYLVRGDLLLGDNYDSTYYKISLEDGDILDTLKNYLMDKEREHLIIDREKDKYLEGYSEHRVDEPGDFKYHGLILKAYDRQYRGDHQTFFITFVTTDKVEKTIKFNRDEFDFISDIVPYDNDKLIIVYNSESAGTDHPYFDNVGLLDLSKCIK